MALKQSRAQRQQRQQSYSRAPDLDPWSSFLDLIDAPQWADLSLEKSLLGKEGDDPWFHVSHKHHLVSLANLNSNMSWLRHEHPWRDKSKQFNDPFKGDEGRMVDSKGRHSKGQLSRPGHGQYTEVSVSQATGCNLSGSSCTSVCEQSKPVKNDGSCSGTISSVESSNLSFSVQRESLSSDHLQISSVTSSHCDPQYASGLNNRNSSGASFCSSWPKLRFSYELRLSTSTRNEAAHTVDLHSVAGRVMTAMSGSKSEEEGTQLWNSNVPPKVGKELEVRSSRGSAESDASNRHLILCQRVARRVLNDEATSVSAHMRDYSMSNRPMETRSSQIEAFPRKKCVSEKENAQQLMSAKRELKSQEKGRVAQMVQCPFPRPKVEKAKQNPAKLDAKQQILKSVLEQGKRINVQRRLPGRSACENLSQSEGDSTALVAQHHCKFQTHGMRGCRKAWK